ncbi:MAG TPA: FimV/HubP family polar landmark protein [Gallionella sp.]|nr:FimV/HubP family polar landmark protein [Gallionella sp.]
MRKSLLKLLGFVVALALSTTVSAMGLGGINVQSALGQPLKADIELVSLNKAEKASLVARLASADAYKGAGLEFPYGNKFKFQVESRADGSSYLKASSAQPVNDPFVSLLVEVTWSSGRLLREYTFLLDPPGYVPEQPAPAEVVVVAPAAPAEAVAAVEPAAAAPAVEPAVSNEQAAEALKKQAETMRAEAPVDQKALAKSTVAVQESKPAAKSLATLDVTVQRGDTLNMIAAQNKPVDVSLERMLVALYRANAQQFDNKNMNRIKTGKILRMPEQDELHKLSQSEAVREIRAQAADWNAYRQKLAGAASVSTQPQESQQVSAGKISSSVTDKTPVAKDSAKEVLKLSKGEAPGDKAAGAGKSMSAQDKKNAAQEEEIAKAKAMKEEQSRLALLEQNVKDMQRLAELKSAAAALAQPASAASEVAPVSAVAAASEVVAASAPVAQPKPKVVAPKVVAPQPTLVDEILGEPLYQAAGAAVLLALGGLAYMLNRRKKKPAAAFAAGEEEIGDSTGRMAMPQESSPDTGDFTTLASNEASESRHSDDVDPISEADLFLNFGRDAQAEEVLKEALRNTPDDHRIHLKLLGIYANRVDVKSFSAIALLLKDSGDEAAWQQAASMGRKLEPNNPLYGGDAHIEDADSATMQTPAMSVAPEEASSVDFDLGEAGKTMVLSPEDMPEMEAVPEKQPEMLPESTMDFDLTSTSPSMVAPEMDFDVTSTNPSMHALAQEAEESAEAGLPNLDDLIFDVTSTHPAMPALQPEEPEAKASADEDGMEFTLDFPITEKSEAAVQPEAAEMGLSGISLNLDDIGMPEDSGSEGKDERWHEVATKLDLARAYQEMGDQTGAREILEEVMRDGDEAQREAAQSLIDQLI